MRMTTRLKASLTNKALTHIIGAHDPLGARLAEEAGFDGIWASGFEISAAHAIPDASLISMSQHLEATRVMVDAVGTPVVADIDTGYGNAINVMHTIEKYEAAGVAAIVIEDKSFPKDTSLLEGGRQELLRIEEFQGKIEAAVSARKDPDFMIVARTEALIAGQGQAEAKKRGEAYVTAGADAVLVHSKQKTPDEIVEFSRAWDLDAPIVIVPTAYPDLTEARITELGNIKLVIYGNHGVRAIVGALRDTFGRIRADGGIHQVHGDLPPVSDVFDLQGVPAMKANEKKYLR
jgi:phosphoenolpyruvate phosphomutase